MNDALKDLNSKLIDGTTAVTLTADQQCVAVQIVATTTFTLATAATEAQRGDHRAPSLADLTSLGAIPAGTLIYGDWRALTANAGSKGLVYHRG